LQPSNGLSGEAALVAHPRDVTIEAPFEWYFDGLHPPPSEES
jgi:hypothetical protein